MHELGQHAGARLDRLGVEAQLQHVAGLGLLAGELGVDRLVGERAGVGVVDPAQEVGDAPDALVHERHLEHDVVTLGQHVADPVDPLLERLAVRLVLLRHLEHRQPLVPIALEHRLLVFEALVEQHLGHLAERTRGSTVRVPASTSCFNVRKCAQSSHAVIFEGDVHRDLGDVTEDDIRAAHERDLEVQGEHGVRFLTFWFNEPDGHAFCLVEAPDKESAIACHKASHGLVPHDMIQVDRPTISQFMGDWEANVPDIARIAGPGSSLDSGLRAIMFTDLEGSTAVSSREGDGRALEVIERHDSIVRTALATAGGREVKHTGDGILACFNHISRAVDCSVEIQRAFGDLGDDRPGGRVRIGLSAGEPVDRDDDLYGAVVNLAARICGHAEPGQILVSAAVKELAIGKSLGFIDRGPIALKGFDDPVRLYQIGTIA